MYSRIDEHPACGPAGHVWQIDGQLDLSDNTIGYLRSPERCPEWLSIRGILTPYSVEEFRFRTVPVTCTDGREAGTSPSSRTTFFFLTLDLATFTDPLGAETFLRVRDRIGDLPGYETDLFVGVQ